MLPPAAAPAGVTLAQLEADVAKTYKAWREAVQLCEEYRRLHHWTSPEESKAKYVPQPPAPISRPHLVPSKPGVQDKEPRGKSGMSGRWQTRRTYPHTLPEGWPVDGTPCALDHCPNPLIYPRQYKKFCSEECFEAWKKAWGKPA